MIATAIQRYSARGILRVDAASGADVQYKRLARQAYRTQLATAPVGLCSREQ